jgi:hypothetical protein
LLFQSLLRPLDLIGGGYSGNLDPLERLDELRLFLFDVEGGTEVQRPEGIVENAGDAVSRAGQLLQILVYLVEGLGKGILCGDDDFHYGWLGHMPLLLLILDFVFRRPA